MNDPDKPVAATQGAENAASDTSGTKPEWKPTSRAFRRAAKKGNFDPTLPQKGPEGNQGMGGKRKRMQ